MTIRVGVRCIDMGTKKLIAALGATLACASPALSSAAEWTQAVEALPDHGFTARFTVGPLLTSAGGGQLFARQGRTLLSVTHSPNGFGSRRTITLNAGSQGTDYIHAAQDGSLLLVGRVSHPAGLAFTRVSADGTVGPASRISPMRGQLLTANWRTPPGVAFAADGTAVVAYSWSTRAGEQRLQAAILKPGAHRFGPITTLSSPMRFPAKGAEVRPTIAVGAANGGRAVVAWRAHGSSTAWVSSARGDGRFGAPKRLSGVNGKLSAAATPDGHVLVAGTFTRSRASGAPACSLRAASGSDVTRLRLAQVDRGDAPCKQMINISTGLSTAFTSTGRALVAWERPVTVRRPAFSGYELPVVVVASGGRFGRPSALTAQPAESVDETRLAVGSGGRAVASWQRTTCCADHRSDTAIVATVSRDGGDSFSPLARISQLGDVPARSSATVADDGTAIVAWLSSWPEFYPGYARAAVLAPD